MSGFLRAIGRFFSGLLYFLTGGLVGASKQLEARPAAIRAQYDEVIREKKARIDQYMDAVAGLTANRNKKEARLAELTGEVEKLRALQAGAGAKAKQAVAALKAAGKSTEEILADDTVKTCQAAFKDFSSTLKEKDDRCVELENEIEAATVTIEDHLRQLKGLKREIEQIKEESSDAVADVMSAQEEERLANLTSGLSTDRTGEKLARLRDMRQEAKAKAEIAGKIAGTDTRRQEQEFLEYAKNDVLDAAFADIVGLSEETDKSPKRLTEGTKENILDAELVGEAVPVRKKGSDSLPE